MMRVLLRVNYLCLLAVVLMVTSSVALPAPVVIKHYEPLITPGYKPLIEGTEGGIWMVMDKAEYAIQTSQNRIRDAELENYLHDIICKLAIEYCQDIRVYVTRVPHFNAMMAPNGMMIIWTGLLLRVQNEAQLATIIGHELGHYLRQHSLDSFKDAKFKSSFISLLSLGLSAGLAVSGASGSTYNSANLGMDIAYLFTVASIFAHNRGHESEADRYGAELMANAGYDPFQAYEIWNYLVEEEKAAIHKKYKLPFFATHPNPKDRLSYLKEYAGLIVDEQNNNMIINTPRFDNVLTPYIKTMLEDELNLNHYGRTSYLLNTHIKRDIHLGQMLFYKGELHRLRKQEGDLEEAVNLYEMSVLHYDSPPETYRSLGLLDLKAGNIVKARERLGQYLELLPEAEDREMIKFYMATEDENENL